MTARSASAAVALTVVVSATVGFGYFYPQTLSTAGPDQQQSGVSEQTFVCPLLMSGADTSEAVSVLTGPGAAGATGDVSGTSAGTLPLPPPGGGTTVTPDQGGMIKIVARDGAAGNAATVRSYLDAQDEGRGLATSMCPQPKSHWWFVGVSALPGQIDELLLANPTKSPAVVTVDVFGSTGQVDVLGVGGVVVQPGEQTAIRVDSLIPGAAGATLRVTTNGGLVAATVRSTAIDGLIPQGAEFLPAAAEPSREVVVPGVLAGAGARDLVVTAGDQDAAVGVTLITESGAGAWEGGRLIPVPAGTTVTVDVAGALAGRAAAVVLQSTAPVTAAVRSVVPGTLAPDASGVLNRVPSADVAWTAAQTPISSGWMLPLTGIAEAPGGVLLSNRGEPAEVQVNMLAVDGASEQQVVTIDANTIRPLDLPIRPGVPAVVMLTVSRGQVQAASFQVGGLPNGPLATASTGADPSASALLPMAYPDPQVLEGD